MHAFSKAKCKCLLWSGVVALVAQVHSPAQADGELDTTFSGDGIARLTNATNGIAVKVQTDGKIVTVGWPNVLHGAFQVARWNSNGTLDTTFDSDGVVLTSIANDTNTARAIVIQNDNKILVAGHLVTRTDSNDETTFTDFFGVVRYLPNGALDTTFDGDGIVTSTLMENATDIALQTDGKILVSGGIAGQNDPNQSNDLIGAVRFNANGSLDTNFGVGGVARAVFNGARPQGLEVQGDGKVVVCGSMLEPVQFGKIVGAVARFNSNGTLDTSFDGDGKFASLTASGNIVYDVTALGGGKLLLAAATSSFDYIANTENIIVTRLNANGSLDTTFAGDGSAFLNAGGIEWAAKALIDANGRIIVGGGHALARFTADGILDESFARGDGINPPDQLTYINNFEAYINSFDLQSDGKVVAVGMYEEGIANGFFVARFYNRLLPTLTPGAPTITEGNSGSVNATFTVTLSAASTQQVTVNYATVSGTATANSDFTATNGTLTFAAGQTSKTVAVPVLGDLLDEEDELFSLRLSAPVNAALSATVSASATITDDDAAPSLVVSNPRAFLEGSAAAPGTTTFNVLLSAPSGKRITVAYATANGVVNGALAGSDYVAKSGTLIFDPGQTRKSVVVNFIGDSIAELNEPFFLDIKTPVNATIADSRGAAYIGNDDGPTITIDNARAVNEGNSGTTNQSFVVKLSAASTNTITVDWTTANGTAGPADYTVASGRLTFAPGETSKTITVLVKGDTTVEPTETYRVNLTRPTFAIIADSQGIGYIVNDDVAPSSVISNQPSP